MLSKCLLLSPRPSKNFIIHLSSVFIYRTFVFQYLQSIWYRQYLILFISYLNSFEEIIMGAVLGTASLAASLACCCGSAAVSLCCSACPSCKNSTSARIMYSIMLLFTTIISCVMLSPKVEHLLQKLNWLCEKVSTTAIYLQLSKFYEIQIGLGK